MAKLSLILTLFMIASLAFLAGCGEDCGPNDDCEESPPVALAEGSWGHAAELADCASGQICELDRWANETEFRVIVWNEDAEVSSSDSDVLEIVRVESISRVALSVIVRTKSAGDAEFVIDGAAGDQRRLPVHVADLATVRIVDFASGDLVESIDASTAFVRLEAFDREGHALAVQGRWAIDDPNPFVLYPGLWSDDGSETLEHSASAFLMASSETLPLSTMLRVTIGETTLEVPIEL